MATNVDIKEVSVGSASNFRQTINDNFNALKTGIEQEAQRVDGEFKVVYNTMTNFEVSSTEPTEQKVGDFWLKVLPDE